MKDVQARIILEQLANELGRGVDFNTGRVWCNNSDQVSMYRQKDTKEKLELLLNHLNLEVYETPPTWSEKKIRSTVQPEEKTENA